MDETVLTVKREAVLAVFRHLKGLEQALHALRIEMGRAQPDEKGLTTPPTPDTR